MHYVPEYDVPDKEVFDECLVHSDRILSNVICFRKSEMIWTFYF